MRENLHFIHQLLRGRTVSCRAYCYSLYGSSSANYFVVLTTLICCKLIFFSLLQQGTIELSYKKNQEEKEKNYGKLVPCGFKST